MSSKWVNYQYVRKPIKLAISNKISLYQLFGCPDANLGHWRRGSLSQTMFITTPFWFARKVTRSLVTRLGPIDKRLQLKCFTPCYDYRVWQIKGYGWFKKTRQKHVQSEIKTDKLLNSLLRVFTVIIKHFPRHINLTILVATLTH